MNDACATYLQAFEKVGAIKLVFLIGTWILMFTNFVPISLMVCREVVCLWQGVFMSWDLDMYDQDQGM